MAVLFFYGEGEDIKELLAIPMNVSLAYFHLDLSRNVVAILLGFPCADNLLLSIPIILRGLLAPTVELHCVGAGYIVYNLFLHVTVRRLDIAALIIVLGSGVYFVGSVTDTILPCKTPLDLVSFFKRFVVNSFDQIANQFINVETNTLDVGFNDTSAILEKLRLTNFLVLGPASLLLVWLALVLKYHLLNFMAVWIFVHSITSDISLSNIRVVFLSGRRRRVFLRDGWRSTKNSQNKIA